MAWKTAPALAMGNTIVLKSSEQTPLTSLRAGELALEAGIPAGVLNVVPGYGDVAGETLSRHMEVSVSTRAKYPTIFEEKGETLN